MLQVNFLRENKERVLLGLSKRNFKQTELIDEAISEDDDRNIDCLIVYPDLEAPKDPDFTLAKINDWYCLPIIKFTKWDFLCHCLRTYNIKFPQKKPEKNLRLCLFILNQLLQLINYFLLLLYHTFV